MCKMSSILISNHEEFAKLCPTSLPVPVFYYRRIMTGVTFNSLGVLLLICKFSVKICNAQQKLIIQTICLKKLFFNISTHIFNKQLLPVWREVRIFYMTSLSLMMVMVFIILFPENMLIFQYFLAITFDCASHLSVQFSVLSDWTWYTQVGLILLYVRRLNNPFEAGFGELTLTV